MNWKGNTIVNLSRAFLDTNGVRNETSIVVQDINGAFPSPKVEGESIKEKVINLLKSDNVASQQGMVEMFDSHVGASTVLMPYGGKYQLTEQEASVQKIPVMGAESNTASIMAFGYNPFISEWSPFHGAAYAVVESISKIVAVGGKWQGIRFSFQEYFERLGDNKEKWGKPFSALLGTLFVQKSFGLPAIGGKDSMSGTFNNIHVPPTLISFAVNTESADNIISAEFKNSGNFVYLVKHNPTKDLMPNIEELKENYDFVYENITKGKIVSASTIKNGGLVESLAKMVEKGGIVDYVDKSKADINIVVSFKRAALKNKNGEYAARKLKLTTGVTERIIVLDAETSQTVVEYNDAAKFITDFSFFSYI
jgi:phosphoribosylformylglycinamidine synthase